MAMAGLEAAIENGEQLTRSQVCGVDRPWPGDIYIRERLFGAQYVVEASLIQIKCHRRDDRKRAGRIRL
jgi:hypothetical protein